MKKIVGVVIMLGCAHQPGLGPHEICAQNSLVLDSISSESASASGVAAGRGITAVKVESDGNSLSCRRATTVEERCEIEGYVASSNYKARTETRDLDTAYDEATRIGTAARNDCLRRASSCVWSGGCP